MFSTEGKSALLKVKNVKRTVISFNIFSKEIKTSDKCYFCKHFNCTTEPKGWIDSLQGWVRTPLDERWPETGINWRQWWFETAKWGVEKPVEACRRNEQRERSSYRNLEQHHNLVKCSLVRTARTYEAVGDPYEPVGKSSQHSNKPATSSYQWAVIAHRQTSWLDWWVKPLHQETWNGKGWVKGNNCRSSLRQGTIARRSARCIQLHGPTRGKSLRG